eukprot:2967990-Rhodomonas_salina.1
MLRGRSGGKKALALPSPGAARGGTLAKREQKGIWLDQTAFAGWSLALLAAGFGIFALVPGLRVEVFVSLGG